MFTPEEIDAGSLRQTVIDAFDRLPIRARLEFVRDLLLNNGGEKESDPSDSRLVIAAEVIKGVIEVLEKRPRTANLRHPTP
jgi:hypothetical protein